MQRPKRWIRGVVIFVAAVMTLGVVGLLLFSVTTTGGWERYQEEVRARGEPLTFEEIEASLPAIPDEKNSALILDELAPALEAIAQEAKEKGVYILSDNKLDLFRGVDPERIDASRKFCAEHAETLKRLVAVIDRPEGRWRINPTAAVDPTMQLDLPGSQVSRSASKLVALDGALKAIDGQTEGVAESIQLQWRIADANKYTPSTIAALIRTAADALALDTIERGLRVGQFDLDDLQVFEQTLARRAEEDRFRLALLGERAFLTGILDWVVSRKFDPGKADPSEVAVRSGFTPQFIYRRNQHSIGLMIDPLLEASANPERLWECAAQADERVQELGSLDFLAKTFYPSLSRACELNARIILSMQMMRAAIAAERFRIEKGRLPESWDDLVPGYLLAAPIDMYDGRLVRLKATDEGIVIYSVGENRVDDGGSVAAPKERGRVLDIGYRLVRPELRTLKIVAEESVDGAETSTPAPE